jgi:ribosomal protein S18 acetylase RimI-like enzyme
MVAGAEARRCYSRGMRVTSRGLATNLVLAGFDGEVVHGQYVAVRTPSNPAFWWGNFVLFGELPPGERIEDWEATFDREVGRPVPGVEHRHFAWDTIQCELGDAQAFVARGYALGRDIFLSLSAERVLRSPHHRRDIVVRPIAGDAEWAAALALQHESLTPERDTPSFRAYQSAELRRARAMTESGFMQWFGAFARERLVAGMGLCVQQGVGRCQAVATSPSDRRQGHSSTLVHDVSAYGFERMGATEIWIMTDEDNPAARVYRAVGFEDAERVASLSMSRRPSRARGADPLQSTFRR